MDETKRITLGLIVGNRGFFPAHLCLSARKKILEILNKEDIQVITLDESDHAGGSVENLAEAHKCADLFSRHREEIDGILVTLPNFGDERAIANTLRWSNLGVPVLVHAFPDESQRMQLSDRRDSFCGKISTCNNLRQYGIKYSLTEQHVVDPDSQAFHEDLQWFIGVCRVVRGLKNLRVGLVGARPASFNTVRFSETLFERSRISVEPIDLAEIINKALRMTDDNVLVREKLEAIHQYMQVKDPPATGMLRMAKLGAVLDRWATEQELSAMSIQCWTALEEIYGVVPCTLMSMMSNSLLPSSCETDIPGVISMVVLTLASGKPSGIVDWNNNYGLENEKCVIFHCSNLPKDILEEEHAAQNGQKPTIQYHDILSGGFGKENSWGAVVGRMKPGSVTYCRVSSDDLSSRIRAFVGEGEITSDPLETFGGYGILQIQRMKELLHYICSNGFEHHVAINHSQSAAIIQEAFTKYLEWETYHHN